MRVPDYLHAWWSELGLNSATANATHEVWRVHGPGGASRFEAAVRTAVGRHDILNRAVVRRDGAFYLERSSAALSCATSEDAIDGLVWQLFA